MKQSTKLIVLWLVVIFIPLFTLRLFQDEMLYLNMSRKFFHLEFLPRSSLIFALTSPTFLFENMDLRVYLPRVITSLVTLLDVLLVYAIARRLYGDKAGFLSSLMFLLSFVVLRYGARYTLEPWGVLFVLLAIYYFDKKPLLSALSIGLSFCARETWLTTYPFFLIYAWKKNREAFPRMLGVSAITVALNFLFIISVSLYGSPLEYNARDVLSWGVGEILKRAVVGWLEFVIGYLPIVLGFVHGATRDSKNKAILWLVLPSLVTLNGVNGFLINGPFERYTFGPLALMSIYSGYGLIELYGGISKKLSLIGKMSLERWVVIALILQFLAFNVAVLKLSNIGAKGIQDYGYWYDREVFGVLEEYGSQEDSFGGTPHPAILGFRNWTWADRNLTKVLNMSPDWLVTFQSWVNVNRDAVTSGAVEMWNFGPYVVIHARQEGAIKEYVTPMDFPLWGRSGEAEHVSWQRLTFFS